MYWSPYRSSIVYQNWKGIESVAFLISFYPMSTLHIVIPFYPCVRQVAAAEDCLKPVGSSKSAFKDSSSKVRDLNWHSDYYLRWSRMILQSRKSVVTINFFRTPGSSVCRPFATSRVDHIFQDTAQLKGVNSRLTFSNYWFTVLVILLFM